MRSLRYCLTIDEYLPNALQIVLTPTNATVPSATILKNTTTVPPFAAIASQQYFNFLKQSPCPASQVNP